MTFNGITVVTLI